MVPFLLLAVLTVRQDHTPLRTGCGEGQEAVASLAAGTPVEIRFGIADGSRCLKVAATVDGQSMIGYVPEDALSGMDQFDIARNSGSNLDAPIQDLARQLSATQSTAGTPLDRAMSPLVRAMSMLQANRPQEALSLLETL